MGISRKKTLAALCITLAMPFMWACEGFSFSFTLVSPKTASATDTHTAALEANAKVVVNNDNGSTRVEVDPNATQATIEVERLAYGGTQDEVDALLQEIEVTLTNGVDGGTTFQIDVVIPNAASSTDSDFEFSLVDDELVVTGILRTQLVAAVRLHITLPPGHGVEVKQVIGAIRADDLDTASTLETQRGSIRVVDATGDITAITEQGSVDVRDHDASLDVETEQGSVRVEVSELEADEQIVVRTDRGAIECRLPHDIDAQLEAQADHGVVDFDLRDFDLVSNASDTFDSIVATLNAGGPTIDLETDHGMIDIDGN